MRSLFIISTVVAGIAFADAMDAPVRRGGRHYLECFAWAAMAVYFITAAIGAAFGRCA